MSKDNDQPDGLIDEVKQLRSLVADFKRILRKIATNKGFRLPAKEWEENTLWEHCRRLMNISIAQGEHRVPERESGCVHCNPLKRYEVIGLPSEGASVKAATQPWFTRTTPDGTTELYKDGTLKHVKPGEES